MRLKLTGFIVILLCLIGNSKVSYAQSPDSVGNLSNLNSAQELCRIIGSQFAVPVINYEPVTIPKFWTKGVYTELGFSQISFSNWAAGGSESISLNSYVNAHINYAKGSMYWDNRAILSYGFIQSFKDDIGYRKSDDKINLDSKWGYKLMNKFYFSANMNFKSQFSPGFEYSGSTSKKVSQFLTPGYFNIGIGIDYKPGNAFSATFSPLTGNLVIVTDSLLRAKYGNAPDEVCRWQLGAQLKTTFNKEIFKDCKIGTTLTLFSNYMKKPQNIKVNWDFEVIYKFHKFFQAGLRTNLIYDDDILITGKDGVGRKRVQFKEVASITFGYTIGNFKK